MSRTGACSLICRKDFIDYHNMKKLILVLLFCVSGLKLFGQVPIVPPDFSHKTLIAPGYFGPNAFQVPEMLDGNVSDKFRLDLAFDYYKGSVGKVDDTIDIFLDMRIPLFSDRVNLSIWWPMQELYRMSEDVADYRRIVDRSRLKGNECGPIYVSVDIQLLKEKKICPALSIRSVLRTAAEGRAFSNARSYDCPAYFFDAAVGKGFGPFRLALSAGFLCWQTDNGRQNDALMLGVLASYSHEWFKLSSQFGGYSGWERDGDRPVTLRARFDFGPQTWNFKPFVSYQHGFRDWPFDQFRAGVSYSHPMKFRK